MAAPGDVDPLRAPGTAMTEVDDRQVRHRVTGSGDPLLLLHGIGRSLEDWDEQHDRLSAGHELHSLDLPGFGWSDPVAAPTTLESLADALPACLDAAGVAGPVTVVGNSLGGAVAMTLATRHPGRVRALVLADSAGFGRQVTVGLRMLAFDPLATLLMRPTPGNSRRSTRTIFHDPALTTDERVRHAQELSARPTHAATMLDIARDLGTVRGVSSRWRRPLVEGVRESGLPVLAVWGDRDRILPPAHLAAVARELPDARTRLIPDCGHMPQIERPDLFAGLVEDFLVSLPPVP
ncbi:pimeloyl-ACP methyl ester carboxylesterase [Clavibacter michiganensis]|uniref:alpha/beta fold hydrolase n=1 Tax=Clavibacter michiganensis TaxID=28447 RepID=UPI001AE4BEE6|nr:alpha/beta fold hydrolase [Clavibacter michiganensis]MBP2456621.1 pimeloyl-ACP methyl ester carboxylesterase [Clavibacter michiganensis]MDQ0409191.1 pimeloyl-ACP methyl ester carboxylesterase [Clavibacter michiganensis]